MSTDLKHDIQTALQAFKVQALADAAIGFWKVLGYESQRRLDQVSYTYSEFCENFSSRHLIHADKALAGSWVQFCLLFQLTADEVKLNQTDIPKSLFDVIERPDLQPDNHMSYLFTAIELSCSDLNRTKLVSITREINRCFAMPVLLLVKTGGNITIALINRRLNKLDDSKDVLEKVILIKDINLVNPHRGHLDILQKLYLPGFEIDSIGKLQSFWSKILSVKELNREFYFKITSWYQSALAHISLCYTDKASENDKVEAKKYFLVKTLCRMMFCWFIKEKGLIAPEILELTDIRDRCYSIIKDPYNPDSNSYYRGILRTLFFDVLNSPMNKRVIPVDRLKKYTPDGFDKNVFKHCPYLNGSIFNHRDEGYEDYCEFGDRVSDDLLKIPNKIFYGFTPTRDNPGEDVPGLNRILSSYKFTIEENTPLEEDVALDPELLGTVFENLLAELDPDEKIAKNARRNSGSFYTPREVIDFMVNDALVLYLETRARQMGYHDYIERVKYLVYHEIKDDHDDSFDSFIVCALDKIRILDPACGSGAFPMGMLHRITRILSIVDPDNSKWIKLKLVTVESGYRDEFERHLREHYTDYPRKVGILRDSIYGVDIQPLAGHISKLRFFISLIVDQKADQNKDNFGISQLPNLETNIICANSLYDLEPNLDIFQENVVDQLAEAIEKYYKEDHDDTKKEEWADLVAKNLSESYQSFDWGIVKSRTASLKERWKRWFEYGNIACPFFNPKTFFPAVMKQGGFDIVIGNPPYGGTSLPKDLQNVLGVGSGDPYGAFIARFMNRPDVVTPLKPGGVLAFIVSDTFMTIKSHRPLREQILENYVHKMVRMHPDTFKQVVNTAVILLQKADSTERIGDDHNCLMVDMTNISIHTHLDRFLDILYDIVDMDKVREYSDKVYAIFLYKQNLIKDSSLLPFFVAPPKLFTFMRDRNIAVNPDKAAERRITINDKVVSVYKLSDIASVTQGLATGDNKSYLYQTPQSGRSYRDITPYWHLVISDDELKVISENEQLRLKIIEHGFHKSRDEQPFDPERWFGGKHIVPYDKGGASDTDSGWLPNYYVKTDYYIDWSSWAVERLKTLTIGVRDGTNNNDICSRFQNKETYYSKGITFSITGMYAPTFRLSSRSVYDVKGSMIFITGHSFETYFIMGVLCSKVAKLLSKTMIYHTVDMQVDAVKEIPIVAGIDNTISELVNTIIDKQKSDPTYHYANNEQIEIDKLVYRLYGLNNEDIRLVEDWYARRYPKLTNNALLDD